MKKKFTKKNKYFKYRFKKRSILRKVKNRKFYQLLKLPFILFLLFLSVPLIKKEYFLKNKYKSSTKIEEMIYLNETMHEAVKRAKDFYYYANSGILTTNIKEKVDYPKFSVIIPAYSSEKYIKRAVRSAQNQNFYDIEIIVIDDFSTDNTVKILEEMEKEDPRIKIIKNHKNSGMLYSRSLGALLSKGLYILPMDSDDIFLNNDTFSYLNQEIDKLNVDIIKFRAIESLNTNNPLYGYLKIVPDDITENKILYQPDLGIFGEKRCVLWEQCINGEFYKKVVNLYGKERINRYVRMLEDCIMHFILYQNAKSLKLFLKIGLLHIKRSGSDSCSTKESVYNKNFIYLNEVYFEFAKYVSWTKDSLIKNIIDVISKKSFQETLNDTESKNEIKRIIKKIALNNNITLESKEALINVSLQIKLFENRDMF